MKYHFTLLILAALATAPPAGHAGPADRRLERLEDAIADLRKEEGAKRRESAEAARDWAKAKVQREDAASKLRELERSLPRGGARSGEQVAAWQAGERELARRTAAEEVARDRMEALKQEQADLKTEVERKEDSLARAEEAAQKKDQPKEKPASPDCPDGTCAGGRKGPGNQEKSPWEGIADVLKAATPLGLGAMNTYLGYQGMKQQSSDYRFYSNNLTSLGLTPAAPPGYGSSIASYAGMNSALMGSFGGLGGTGFGGFGLGGLSGFGGSGGFGGSMGFGLGVGLGGYGGLGGFGGFGGLGAYGGYGGVGNYSGFGSTGYFPSTMFGYGSMGSYSPYGSSPYASMAGAGAYGYSSVWNSYTGAASTAAAQRMAIQQSINSSDALVAAQSLSSAYSGYNQATIGLGGYTGYGVSYPYGVTSLTGQRQ